MKRRNKYYRNMNSEKETRKAADETSKEPEVETFDDLPADEEGTEIEAEKDIINEQMNDLEQLRSQLDEANAKIEEEKKEYLFLRAEFDNFRKRTLKEKAEIIKTASEGALKDLLPIVDDFERAIEANRGSDDTDAIKEGTELIYNKLVKYLDNKGVKAIDSNGKDFDADYHEAIAMVPVGDDAEKKGKVIDTLTKGYTMGDKVIRHAKVAVGQ